MNTNLSLPTDLKSPHHLPANPTDPLGNNPPFPQNPPRSTTRRPRLPRQPTQPPLPPIKTNQKQRRREIHHNKNPNHPPRKTRHPPHAPTANLGLKIQPQTRLRPELLRRRRFHRPSGPFAQTLAAGEYRLGFVLERSQLAYAWQVERW